jgi:hypothetical protein
MVNLFFQNISTISAFHFGFTCYFFNFSAVVFTFSFTVSQYLKQFFNILPLSSRFSAVFLHFSLRFLQLFEMAVLGWLKSSAFVGISAFFLLRVLLCLKRQFGFTDKSSTFQLLSDFL